MKVVITSATETEQLQIKKTVETAYKNDIRLKISFKATGIGMLQSCFSLSKIIFEQKPDLIIQVGIAGTFNNTTNLGKVVVVKEETLADTGVEEKGDFLDLFDMNLQNKDNFPFTDKKLVNNNIKKWNLLKLEEVTAITINEITTNNNRIKQLKDKYNPELESMEGAALHYCCLQTGIPFIQIRAVSNYIGERNKMNWKFTEAIENLTSVTIQYLSLTFFT